MERKTHNGTIASDETFAPGTIRFSCKAYNLPDNTMGKTGWHCIYRPCNPTYSPDTPENLKTLAREHMAEVEVTEKAEAEAKAEKEHADFMAWAARQPKRDRNKPKGIAGVHFPCPRCHTYCCGDCEE